MDIIISNDSDKPIYEQITSQIKNQIMQGSLREGFITTVVGKGSFIKAADTRLLREENLKRIEEHFQEAIRIASESGVTRQELEEIFAILYEG